MPTNQEHFDQMQLDQLRDSLQYEEGLEIQLAGELAELQSKENAARRIIREIAELGGHGGDQHQADAKLRKFADQRAVLERRITQAKARRESIRGQIARFDHANLQRVGKIRELFKQLASGEGRRQQQV